jgi:hypothetical protein
VAYRDDLAALEAFKVTVDAELAEKQRARDEVVWMIDEARRLAQAEAALLGEAPEPKPARRRPTVWLAALAALLGLGGFAAYRATRSTPNRAEASLREMASWVDAVCACKDGACIQRLSEASSKSRKEAPNQKPPTLDEAQTRRMDELDSKAIKCFRDALTPPPAPSVPTPPSASSSEDTDPLDGSELAVTPDGQWYLVPRHVPDAIDRVMIAAGIAPVRSQVRACGDQSAAEGKVQVSVKVGANGKVTSVHVEDTPDPFLGACVAAAVTRATFAKTHNGGSFAYPFVFDPSERARRD